MLIEYWEKILRYKLYWHRKYFILCVDSSEMRWAGHVARMGEERGCIGFWWGNRRKGDHGGDLGVDGWIILGWISRR